MLIPIEGTPLHTRTLAVAISRQSDSSWLARGDVIDLRKTGFVPASYDIQPAGIIHSMSIELAFDPNTLRIERVEVDQPFVAIEASERTGGECCRDPAPRLLEFAGDTLDAGFTRRLSEKFGGPLGCSHLLTLFQLMASTIPHAVALEQARASQESSEALIGARFFRRAIFVDGFEKNADETDVAIQLTDTHVRPPSATPRSPSERLAAFREFKIHATVERKRFRIARLGCVERLRNHESLGHANWIDHSERLGEFVETPLIPGLAGRLFKALGQDEAIRPLLDALLQFAPGFIQITAALMDRFFEARATIGADGKVEPPAVSGLGGNANACYMWREKGPVMRSERPS